MNEPIKLGGGHCCVCSSICGHIGGPWYCDAHIRQMRLLQGGA